jgi:Tripartite tricarboxylate transporter family receptor
MAASGTCRILRGKSSGDAVGGRAFRSNLTLGPHTQFAGVTKGAPYMKLPRRRFLHLAAGAAAVPSLPRIARGQAYPSRPITMIVPFAAGGPTDTVARILVERMRRSLRQAIIIEDVTGADGSIGTGRAARAKPDGYTIVILAL